MSSTEQTIQKFERLRDQINNARNGNFQVNREIFNELKKLLIENGFDIDVITIDYNDKFFSPPKDYERRMGDPNEKYKDHQGKLAALCTKAIRDLGKKLAAQRIPKEEQQVKTIIKTEVVYPPTSWKLLRNGLFWSILGLILTLSSTAFYFIGQNSKDRENADLVVKLGEKNSDIKELNKEVQIATSELEKCKTEASKLENPL